MTHDLFRFSKELEASLIFLDLIDGSIEVRSLAIRGEDVSPQKVDNAALSSALSVIMSRCSTSIELRGLTVSTKPTTIMPKL